MGKMLINLPESAEQRLREEAAKRNSSAEDFAARLLTDRLRFPVASEFDISDEESREFANLVHKARDASAK